MRLPFAANGMEMLLVLPFAGFLFSIALGPTIFPNYWTKHYFKLALGWIGICVLSLFWRFEAFQVITVLQHTIVCDYIPFIILIGVLFIITSGIQLTFVGNGTPLANLLVLGWGGALASVIGTTGAAMLLIRPLIRLNSNRVKKDHIIIFFIFIVANVGGILTPLGDPPLFLGYLKGVSFTWPMINLFKPFLVIILPLLFIFYVLDCYFFAREPKIRTVEIIAIKSRIKAEGLFNLIPLFGVILVIWLSGIWVDTSTIITGSLKKAHLARDILLILLAILSWYLTPKRIRQSNDFSWKPFYEVAKIFIAIFITITPVIEMLNCGLAGPFAGVLAKANPSNIPGNSFYFWATGLLSAFLDNAPTYLVFFHIAGGEPQILMTLLRKTLIAISCGAVFMGALSYIGNAPNFMIKSIAEAEGIKMPGFLGYMTWSFTILIPLFSFLIIYILAINYSGNSSGNFYHA